MNKREITPASVYDEFSRGVAYKNSIDLYNIVEQNENFYVGKQWEGVAADNIDKPVIDICKPAISYKLAVLVSDDIGAQVNFFGMNDEASNMAQKCINGEIDRIFENTKLKAKNRQVVRNAAVDGDGALFFDFDADIRKKSNKDKRETDGEITVQVIENTDIVFGNASTPEVERQPYLIVASRYSLASAKALAVELGLSEEEAEKMQPDDIQGYSIDAQLGEFTTVYTRFWKEDGTVHMCRCTKDLMIKPPTDLLYTRYPIAYMNWETVKNSYHGVSEMTKIIPNQIYINKMYAMIMATQKKVAFPKIVYNRDIMPGGWDEEAMTIEVNGSPREAFASALPGADVSAMSVDLVSKIMADTKESLGASSAALGNVKPDNTSAIIAVQNAAAAPLELQRMAFYQFVEDYVNILVDIMAHRYGMRVVEVGDEGATMFDFSTLQEYDYKLNVNIGASTYWSELMQTQTNDNLWANQIITDPVLYLEGVPDKFLHNKQKVIDQLEQQKEAATNQGEPGEAEILNGLSLENQAAVAENPELLRTAMMQLGQ